MVLKAFRSGVFQSQPIERSGNRGISERLVNVSGRLHLKMLTPKPML